MKNSMKFQQEFKGEQKISKKSKESFSKFSPLNNNNNNFKFSIKTFAISATIFSIVLSHHQLDHYKKELVFATKVEQQQQLQNEKNVSFFGKALPIQQENNNDNQQDNLNSKGCRKIYYGNRNENNIACECKSRNSCDSFEHFEWPQDEQTYLRFVSDLSGLRFYRDELNSATGGGGGGGGSSSSSNNSREIDYLIEFDCDRRAQQISGFGGAFTDSASEMISSLNDELKLKLMEDYFGLNGLQYNMGRVPIAGTDMSTRTYSYDDLPIGEEDLELKKFKLQEEDLLFKIPLIKLANKIRIKFSIGDDNLKLIAASWSAPAWMKSNLQLVQGHLIGNSTNAPYYDAYARYIIKFLLEYEKRDIKMWGLTPQNEPHTPTRIPLKIQFNSVNFGPKQMTDYLANSLIPELLMANFTKENLKLFIWDDTMDDLELYQLAALESKIVKNFMTGTAIHWYSQGLRGKPYSVLSEMRKHVIPADFSLISTEACYIGKPQPGNWARGEGYVKDIIENLRAGSVAWIDWNLALNTSGGPTWIHNHLDSPILINPIEQYYIKNPMFYALGHITRFIKPNSFIIPTVAFKKQQQQQQQKKIKRNSNEELSSTSSSWMQTNHLDLISVIAAELEEPSTLKDDKKTTKILERRISLVLSNKSNESKLVKLALGSGCVAKVNQKPLEMELRPRSITSLAFLC